MATDIKWLGLLLDGPLSQLKDERYIHCTFMITMDGFLWCAGHRMTTAVELPVFWCADYLNNWSMEIRGQWFVSLDWLLAFWLWHCGCWIGWMAAPFSELNTIHLVVPLLPHCHWNPRYPNIPLREYMIYFPMSWTLQLHPCPPLWQNNSLGHSLLFHFRKKLLSFPF